MPQNRSLLFYKELTHLVTHVDPLFGIAFLCASPYEFGQFGAISAPLLCSEFASSPLSSSRMKTLIKASLLTLHESLNTCTFPSTKLSMINLQYFRDSMMSCAMPAIRNTFSRTLRNLLGNGGGNISCNYVVPLIPAMSSHVRFVAFHFEYLVTCLA